MRGHYTIFQPTFCVLIIGIKDLPVALIICNKHQNKTIIYCSLSVLLSYGCIHYHLFCFSFISICWSGQEVCYFSTYFNTPSCSAKVAVRDLRQTIIHWQWLTMVSLYSLMYNLYQKRKKKTVAITVQKMLSGVLYQQYPLSRLTILLSKGVSSEGCHYYCRGI